MQQPHPPLQAETLSGTAVQPPSARSAGWRKKLLHLHLFAALGLGLFVSVITVTGSISQYRKDIERWLIAAPAGVRGDTDPSATAAALKSRYPGRQLTALVVSRGDGEADTWTLRNRDPEAVVQTFSVFTDPGTGAWLGDSEASLTARFLASTYHFHHMMWIRTWGRWLVGVAGFATLILVLGGVVLAWPHLRAWVRSGRLLRFADVRDWHLRAGTLLAPILLASALTGILCAYIAWWRPPLLAASRQPVPASVTALPGEAKPDWGSVIAISALAAPNTTLHGVQAPRHGDTPRVWRVVRRWDGELSPRDGVLISVDADSGAVVGIEDPRHLDPARLLLFQQISFHIGWFAGLDVRWLWLLVGLSPPAFLVSGLILWRRRRANKATAKRTKC